MWKIHDDGGKMVSKNTGLGLIFFFNVITISYCLLLRLYVILNICKEANDTYHFTEQ